MKEQEIPFKIAELKQRRKEANDETLAEYDKHFEVLQELEEEFGFDLDVATDIYENRLIDPIEARKLIEEWVKLLSAIKENPGNALLVTLTASVPTGITSIVHSPNLKYQQRDVEVAIVKNVTLDSFVYIPASEETSEDAYIGIKGETIIRRPVYESQSQNGLLPIPVGEGGLIVAQDFDPYRLFAPSARSIGDEGVSTLYNPTWQEARQLIDAQVDDETFFPVHFLDPFRHKNTVKS